MRYNLYYIVIQVNKLQIHSGCHIWIFFLQQISIELFGTFTVFTEFLNVMDKLMCWNWNFYPAKTTTLRTSEFSEYTLMGLLVSITIYYSKSANPEIPEGTKQFTKCWGGGSSKNIWWINPSGNCGGVGTVLYGSALFTVWKHR